MGLARRILSSFKPKKEEEGQKSNSFLQNGGKLLTGLLAFSNGGHDISIRSFSVKELVRATKNFSERVIAGNDILMFSGHIDGRQILVNKWTDGRDEAIRDLVIASHMNHHNNVLKLIGCCLELAFPASVYECAGSVLLSDLLGSTSDNGSLSWRRRLKIASDISSTVLYLHTAFSTPVIYRNIKSSNIIIDRNGVAKLFDFRLCIPLPPGKLHVELPVEDSFRWAVGSKYLECHMSSFVITQKTDVYSFAVFLLVLLIGKSAIPSICEDHERAKFHVVNYVKHYVDNNQFDEFIDPGILDEVGGRIGNDNLLLSFLDLALMCTRENEEDRPEMIDVARQLLQMEKSIRNPLPSISS